MGLSVWLEGTIVVSYILLSTETTLLAEKYEGEEKTGLQATQGQEVGLWRTGIHKSKQFLCHWFQWPFSKNLLLDSFWNL